MAQYSWTYQGSSGTNTAYLDAALPTSVIFRGDTAELVMPDIKARHTQGVNARYYYDCSCALALGAGKYDINLPYAGPSPTVALGAWGTLKGFTKTLETSYFFDASNPTERIYPAYFRTNGFNSYIANYGTAGTWTNSFSLGAIDLILDVPPTFSYDPLTIDTPWIYTGLTTASVDVDNLTAYYGGYITEAKLTIGNQTAILTGDDTDILSSGTLSILLNAVGTFTPTLTVTDSRGQVKTETLESITVLGYVNPSVSLGIERTDNTGAPADEGTYAVLTAKFTFTDAVATLSEPVVTGGTSVTWYTTRSSAGVVSNSVDWNDTSGISSGDTLYGLVGTFSPNQSYVISVEPKDSKGTGTSVSITLATAFFTIDFLAGGHGIAFGKPAVTDDLFECDLDAQFNKHVNVGGDFIAQDMNAQEVQDFIDSLNVGGGGTAVDLVVEQGTSGIWAYRKWSSGIAECWGHWETGAFAGTLVNNWYCRVHGPIAFPVGLFAAAPYVNFSLTYWNTGYFWGGVRTVSKDQFSIHTINNSAGSSTAAGDFYAIGRWK